jgi:N-acetylglucosaminyl-diphospho-decaprenol L-rhamnosyltransferase
MKMNIHTTSFDLAVVVINFRTPELTFNCLKSLSIEIQDLNSCIVLVDNNSADGSIDKIEQDIKVLDIGDKLLIYRSSTNGGFAAGNNLGIKTIQADFYLLTNSDTLIRKEALHTLLASAKKNIKIGLLAPRLEWLDGTSQESCFKFHNPLNELISSAKTGFITRLFNDNLVPQSVSEQPNCYDWVSFACVLINHKVFKEIGLMDEGYFMYFEDVEFCHRAKQSGWNIMYEPSAHVVHLRGGSSPLKQQAKLRKRLPRYFYESRTRYFFQIYGRSGLLSANLLWTLGWIISSFRSIFSSIYSPDTSEKQWRDIWINFTNPLRPYLHPDYYDKT